ncbi:MAG: hypothetical protein WDM85_18310 [Caulobacteraceae bacterium]
MDGRDGDFHYRGRGPIELGLRGELFRRRSAVVSLYVGGVVAGEGLNAVYAPPGAGKGDIEVRLLAGDSGTVFHRHVFEEIQVAACADANCPTRSASTPPSAWTVSPAWMVMVQSYSGLASTPGPDPRWFKAEASLVRRLGSVRVQAGWRETMAGRQAPREHGPVLAVWKTF